jgi:hypothetical protein
LAKKALEKGNERRTGNQPEAVAAFVFSKPRAVPSAWLREKYEHVASRRRINALQPKPTEWSVV